MKHYIQAIPGGMVIISGEFRVKNKKNVYVNIGLKVACFPSGYSFVYFKEKFTSRKERYFNEILYMFIYINIS